MLPYDVSMSRFGAIGALDIRMARAIDRFTYRLT
jgi:hypothetical protein